MVPVGRLAHDACSSTSSTNVVSIDEDNGAPMKSQVLQVKLDELKITASHSHPRVSNDNAHVESLLRTLKYVPAWPEKEFSTLEEARAWVESFVSW